MGQNVNCKEKKEREKYVQSLHTFSVNKESSSNYSVWFIDIGAKQDKLYLLIPELPQDIDRLSWVANHLPLDEGDVETWGVVVDKLKQEHLHGQTVLIIRAGPRDLCFQGSDPWKRKMLRLDILCSGGFSDIHKKLRSVVFLTTNLI